MINILSDTEIREVLAYLERKNDEKKLLIVTLALFSGLRASEIANLKWRDVLKGFSVKKFFVPSKAKKNNKMPAMMNPYSAKILMEAVTTPHKRKKRLPRKRKFKKHDPMKYGISPTKIEMFKNDPYVLGKSYSGVQMWRLWQSIQKQVYGYSAYRFHDLRHTAITNFYRRTRDIVLTQQFARHKNINCTMIYVHIADRDKMMEYMDNIVNKYLPFKPVEFHRKTDPLNSLKSYNITDTIKSKIIEAFQNEEFIKDIVSNLTRPFEDSNIISMIS